jgi:hypothetical protein
VAKKRQTFGKMQRERERAEKRARKQEKKDEKKALRAAAEVDVTELEDEAVPETDGPQPGSSAGAEALSDDRP